MILVTLGTHPQPMDRLLRRLDELVASGEIDEPVVVQTPALNYRPAHLDVRPVLPYRELLALLEQASVVVSHAGPATLANVRLSGKVPVVVARSRREGEHIDDHQAYYARRVSELPGYIVVDELSELGAAIARARTADVSVATPDLRAAVDALESLIGCQGL